LTREDLILNHSIGFLLRRLEFSSRIVQIFPSDLL